MALILSGTVLWSLIFVILTQIIIWVFLFYLKLNSTSGLKETENRKNKLVLLFCKNTE